MCFSSGEALGAAIAENIGLKELKISWNHLHSEGAVALAKGVGVGNVFTPVLNAEVSHEALSVCTSINVIM